MPLIPGNDEREARSRRKRGALWMLVPVLLPSLLLGGVLLFAYFHVLALNVGRYELVCGQQNSVYAHLTYDPDETVAFAPMWATHVGPLLCACFRRQVEVSVASTSVQMGHRGSR